MPILKTPDSILKKFLGTECESCGLPKPKGTAFCKKCYYSLPHSMRSALWYRMGEGFEEGYTVAIGWLHGEGRFSRVK